MPKIKKCKICNGEGHTAFYCSQKPRKPIKRSPIKVKKVIKKKPKAKSRSFYVKKLDSVFSQWVRLEAADSNGIGECVTCGERKHWKEMQNCHFYSRGRYPTRWNDINCHIGCYRCNVILKGNYINYTKYMIDTFGREVVDELEALSISGEKIPTPKIRELIEQYSHLVKELLSEKSG